MVIYSNLQKAESILNSDQVAQAFVRQDLKNLKDRDSTALLGSLSQCLIIFTVNGYFSLRLSLLCLDLRTWCLIFCPSTSLKGPALFTWLPPYLSWKATIKLSSPGSIFSRLSKLYSLIFAKNVRFSFQLVWSPSIEYIPVIQYLSWTGRKRGGDAETSTQCSRWVLTSADKKGNGALPPVYCLTQLSAFTAARGHCKTLLLSTEL